MVVILTEIVSNILAKRLILVTGLGPGRATDGYITILKIEMQICEDGRRSKIG